MIQIVILYEEMVRQKNLWKCLVCQLKQKHTIWNHNAENAAYMW